MATDIVGSLFGVTPESYQREQRLQAEREALNFAQLTPQQKVSYGAYTAGQQLGQALGGLMGVEDPAMRLYSQRNALARQFDVSTPEGLMQYGSALQKAGDTAGALQAINYGRQMAQDISLASQRQAQTSLLEQQAKRASLTAEREDQLQNELAKLPHDASEDQMIGVLRRYGDPKAVLTAIERKNSIAAQLEERRRIEQEKMQFRKEQIEKDQEFKREMARLQADLKAGTSNLQQQLIQEKIDALRQKKQDAIDKQLGTAEGVIENTKVVLGKIDEAEKLVGKGTTGFGSYLSVIPGTPAKELSSVIGTIKARLGFDQLQQMRNASPTGGALGQVSNRELAALEGALASLDQGLSADALKQNLRQIKDSYSRWQQTALGKLPVDRREQMQSPAQTGVVDFNTLK